MEETTIEKLIAKVYVDEQFTHSEKQTIEGALRDKIPIKAITKWIILSFFALIIAVSFLFMVGYTTKNYNVWAMEMSGKAKLAEATQSRQIQVEQAKAEKEAAIFTADAIKIVGEATKNFPEYRQQIYIQAFAEALTAGTIEQIMYIPTEAGIPILEAQRLSK